MINLLGLVVSFLIPWSLGYSLVMFFFRNQPLSVLWKVSLGYALGMGVLSQWMLILGILKIPFHPMTIGGPLLLIQVAIWLCLLARRKSRSHSLILKSQDQPKSDFVSLGLLIYIFLQTYYVFWSDLNIPLYSWDAFSLHFLQAKILYYERTLSLLPRFPHSSYPLHIPFILTWMGLNSGAWNEQWLKMIFPVTYVAFLLSQFCFLKIYTNLRWALAGIALMCCSNFFLYHALSEYRDFTLMFYASCAIQLLLAWRRLKSQAWLFSAALFSGFATFVKSDGILYLGIPFLIVLILTGTMPRKNLVEKIKLILKFSCLSFTVWLLYALYQHFLVSSSSDNGMVRYDINLQKIVFGFSLENVKRVFVVLRLFCRDLFFSGNWNLIWFLFVLALFPGINKERRNEQRILLVALVMMTVVYLGGYSFTQHFKWVAESDSVLSRGFLPYFPLVVTYIILKLAPQPKDDQRQPADKTV